MQACSHGLLGGLLGCRSLAISLLLARSCHCGSLLGLLGCLIVRRCLLLGSLSGLLCLALRLGGGGGCLGRGSGGILGGISGRASLRLPHLCLAAQRLLLGGLGQGRGGGSVGWVRRDRCSLAAACKFVGAGMRGQQDEQGACLSNQGANPSTHLILGHYAASVGVVGSGRQLQGRRRGAAKGLVRPGRSKGSSDAGGTPLACPNSLRSGHLLAGLQLRRERPRIRLVLLLGRLLGSREAALHLGEVLVQLLQRIGRAALRARALRAGLGR